LARVTKFLARPLFTSRGDPTVEVDVFLGQAMGRAVAPQGASSGRNEAVHLPRGGASQAVKNLSGASDMLLGLDAADLPEVARRLREVDGTSDFSSIGGASAFAFSMACAVAESEAEGKPLYQLICGREEGSLPVPLGNVLGGGKHAGPGSPDIQEFLVAALGAPDICSAVTANLAVHREVRRLIEERDPSFPGGKGDEGAWAPRMNDEEALEVVGRAVEKVSKELGFEMGLGLDMAASSLWDEKRKLYCYARKGRSLSTAEQIGYVLDLIRSRSLFYVEDPLDEEDFDGFKELTARTRGARIVGDDIFVTQLARLRRGISMKAGNGVILKVNQVGPLYEAILFAREAHAGGYLVAASHRSGDTWEPHLAHVAVGTGAELIKCGVVGGERMSKLAELIRLSEQRPALTLAKL
jgi:enolase